MVEILTLTQMFQKLPKALAQVKAFNTSENILTFTIDGQIEKNYTTTINLKYQPQLVIKNLIYLTDHILYQIFKIILNIL